MGKVKAIEIKNGETVFNLASTEANDDWIRAARLLKEGKISEFEKNDAKPMYYREEKDLNQAKRKRRKK
jgi:hypothetical protein